MLGWNINNMNTLFNEESWMWVILNSKNQLLASVSDIDDAELLSKIYQEQEDAYYNSVDFQDDDTRWYGYRWL